MNELLNKIDHLTICKDFLLDPPSPYRRKNISNMPFADIFKKHNGICCYCGKKTKMPEPFQSSLDQFPDMATKEHVYGVFDIRRCLSDKIVLACFKCNNNKGHQDFNAIRHDYKRVPYVSLIDLVTLKGIVNERDILYPSGFRDRI